MEGKVTMRQLDTTIEIAFDIAACACMFVFLFTLLVFGTAIQPYEGTRFNEQMESRQ